MGRLTLHAVNLRSRSALFLLLPQEVYLLTYERTPRTLVQKMVITSRGPNLPLYPPALLKTISQERQQGWSNHCFPIIPNCVVYSRMCVHTSIHLLHHYSNLLQGTDKIIRYVDPSRRTALGDEKIGAYPPCFQIVKRRGASVHFRISAKGIEVNF